MGMYKSASFKELQRKKALREARAGLTRTGDPRRRPAEVMKRAGIGNSRWNDRGLPKGASRNKGGPIGAQHTGR